jgi:hypothetical protein
VQRNRMQASDFETTHRALTLGAGIGSAIQTSNIL